MRNTADAHLDRVAEAIQNYLSQHPGAADSEVGVAQWWLRDWLQQGGESTTPDEVRRALEMLQQRGDVEALDAAAVGRLWRGVTGAPHGRADD